VIISSQTSYLKAYGPANLFDLSTMVEQFSSQFTELNKSGFWISSIGSTGALLFLPDDARVKDDFLTWMRKKISYSQKHRHPGNAFAHLRSTFLGCFLFLPGELLQQQLEDGCSLKPMLLENTAGRKTRPINFTGVDMKQMRSEEILNDQGRLTIKTNGWIDIVEIGSQINRDIVKIGAKTGLASIYSLEEKLSVITIEDDMRLLLDLADFLDTEVNLGIEWRNSDSASHIGAALLGNSVTVPIVEGRLELGTWQQLMVVDFGKPGDKQVGWQLFGKS
jgi:secondary thiamine-phosphate synthase enzyme